MTDDIPAIRKTVAPIAARYGIERMYLFGSRACGDNRPDSDYDFLISRGRMKSLWKFSAFWSELEEAFHLPVDVVSDASFDDEIISSARKDGLLVYESEG